MYVRVISTYHSAQPPRDFLCERRSILIVRLRAKCHGRTRVLHIAWESGWRPCCLDAYQADQLLAALSDSSVVLSVVQHACSTFWATLPHNLHINDTIAQQHTRYDMITTRAMQAMESSCSGSSHETCARRPPGSQARPFRETSSLPSLLRLRRQDH
jgi:hypothetical protein